MRPTGYGRFARAVGTAILLTVPVAKADQVTVDLGTVAFAIDVNASIMNTDYPMENETYTYQVLLFQGNLNMNVGGGQTLGQVLATDLGPQNDGTLTYNFPFALGASGSYTDVAGAPAFGVADPGIVPLTAQTQSGTGCAGTNTVGSTINVDPIYAASTYATILSCDSEGIPNDGFPTDTETSVTLPPLGSVINGDTTTVYMGEAVEFAWQTSGLIGPASGVPEPASLSLGIAGIAALGWIRVRKRPRRPSSCSPGRR